MEQGPGTDRIGSMIAALQEAVKGDFPFPIETSGKSDEIDGLADAVNQVLEIMREQAAARKEAEAALRDSKEDYRLLEANIPGVVYLYARHPDGSHSFPYVNHLSRKLFDIAPEDLMRDPALLTGRIHPDDRERFVSSVERSAKTLQPWRETLRCIVKGEERWFDCVSRPEPQPNGDILWSGITLEITETMRAAEKLRESEAHFKQSSRQLRMALQASRMGTWDWDVRQNRVEWSEETLEIFGESAEKFGGTYEAYLDFAAPEVRGETDRAVKEFLANPPPSGVIHYDHPIVTRDGMSRWVEVHGTIFNDEQGRATRLTGVCTDITERKLTEHALRESERLLNATGKMARIGGWEHDLRTGKSAWTQALHDIIEIPYDREPPGTAEHLSYYPPREQRILEQAYNEAIEKGTPFDLELQGHTATKRLIWCRIRGEPVSEDGRCVAMRGVLQDITERKRAEKELAMHRTHLEKLVESRTAELQAANKELESFAYSVSHDLRAPLRAIEGFTRILLDDYASELDEEGKRLGSIIEQNTQKMGQLIDDLLAFSRLGRTAMHASEIDMKNMARAMYHEALGSEDPKRVIFNVSDLPRAVGDTNLMRQVWMNLLSNALKFSRHREQAVISVLSLEKEDEIIYSVKDNGTGFDMKYKDKVFGVFQRLHSQREFEGTGVGLALVQRIIHRHGGKVWAEGEVDNGATFSFSMPRRQEAPR